VILAVGGPPRQTGSDATSIRPKLRITRNPKPHVEMIYHRRTAIKPTGYIAKLEENFSAAHATQNKTDTCACSCEQQRKILIQLTTKETETYTLISVTRT